MSSSVRGPLWCFFYKGEKIGTFFKAHCHACVERTFNKKEKVLPRTLESEARLRIAFGMTGFVRGERREMIDHLIGSKPCKYASKYARSIAYRVQETLAMERKRIEMLEEEKENLYLQQEREAVKEYLLDDAERERRLALRNQAKEEMMQQLSTSAPPFMTTTASSHNNTSASIFKKKKLRRTSPTGSHKKNGVHHRNSNNAALNGASNSNSFISTPNFSNAFFNEDDIDTKDGIPIKGYSLHHRHPSPSNPHPTRQQSNPLRPPLKAAIPPHVLPSSSASIKTTSSSLSSLSSSSPLPSYSSDGYSTDDYAVKRLKSVHQVMNEHSSPRPQPYPRIKREGSVWPSVYQQQQQHQQVQPQQPQIPRYVSNSTSVQQSINSRNLSNINNNASNSSTGSGSGNTTNKKIKPKLSLNSTRKNVNNNNKKKDIGYEKEKANLCSCGRILKTKQLKKTSAPSSSTFLPSPPLSSSSSSMSPSSTFPDNLGNKISISNLQTCACGYLQERRLQRLEKEQQEREKQQLQEEESQQQQFARSGMRQESKSPPPSSSSAITRPKTSSKAGQPSKTLPSFVKKSDSSYDRKFTAEEKKRISQQFARATTSARLPPNWFKDSEVIKLFTCFRASASDVIPCELPNNIDLYSSSSYHPAHYENVSSHVYQKNLDGSDPDLRFIE